MIPDFLYRKIACYYCDITVRRKDAVQLIVVVQDKVQEKLHICRRCANVIKYMNESWKCGNCKKKCSKKPVEKIIGKTIEGELLEEAMKTFSGPQLKHTKAHNENK